MSKIDQAFLPAGSAPQAIPRKAFLLTACVAVVGSNSLALGPIAPEVARGFGVSVPAVMAASAGFGLATAASALFLARHIDRIGSHRVLRHALALLALALVLSAAAPTVMMLVVAQLLAGIAAGVALPAIYATAAAIAPRGRESETIGVVLTGWTLSMVAGVSLSAVIADAIHWRAVYTAVALLALAAFAAMALSRNDDAGSATAAPPPLQALVIPGVAPLLVACCAFMAAFYGIYGYLGDHLVIGLGHAVSANGLLAVSYGMGFGSAAFLDRVIDRMGSRRAMPLAYLLVGAIYVAMAVVGDSYWAIIGIVFFWGLVNHLGLNVLVMRLAAIDPARRGTIMGLNSAVTYFAVFLGTTGFGPVYADWGFAAAAMLAAGLMVIAALAALAPQPAAGISMPNSP